MKQKSIDEQILQALSFSNLVLLDKCTQNVNYFKFSSKYNNKLRKDRTPSKSKFEKITKTSSTSLINKNNFKQQNLSDRSQIMNYGLQNFVNSKVKINSTELDAFQYPLNNCKSIYYKPVQNKFQSIDDVIKSTSVLHKHKQSPINAWKSKSQEKSPQWINEKPLVFQFNINSSLKNDIHSSVKKDKENQTSQQSHKQKYQSHQKTNKKPKGKFQKPHTNKKQIVRNSTNKKQIVRNSQIKNQEYLKNQKQSTINIKSPKSVNNSDDDSFAVQIEYLYPKKTVKQKKIDHIVKMTEQTANILPSGIGIKNESYSNQFDTRDTCELGPSKLQKLIQVQDNRYKQMILKTFYKHQK